MVGGALTEHRVVIEKINVFEKLAPILLFQLHRFRANRDRELNFHTNEFQFPKQLFMDRALYSNLQNVVNVRSKEEHYYKKIQSLKNKKKHSKKYFQNLSVDQLLSNTLKFLESSYDNLSNNPNSDTDTEDDSESEEEEANDDEKINLENMHNSTKYLNRLYFEYLEETEKNKIKLEELKEQMNEIWNSMKKVEYRLYGIIISERQFSGTLKHYLFLYNFIHHFWYKVENHEIERYPEEQVLAIAYGNRHASACATNLIYLSIDECKLFHSSSPSSTSSQHQSSSENVHTQHNPLNCQVEFSINQLSDLIAENLQNEIKNDNEEYENELKRLKENYLEQEKQEKYKKENNLRGNHDNQHNVHGNTHRSYEAKQNEEQEEDDESRNHEIDDQCTEDRTTKEDDTDNDEDGTIMDEIDLIDDFRAQYPDPHAPNNQLGNKQRMATNHPSTSSSILNQAGNTNENLPNDRIKRNNEDNNNADEDPTDIQIDRSQQQAKNNYQFDPNTRRVSTELFNEKFEKKMNKYLISYTAEHIPQLSSFAYYLLSLDAIDVLEYEICNEIHRKLFHTNYIHSTVSYHQFENYSEGELHKLRSLHKKNYKMELNILRDFVIGLFALKTDSFVFFFLTNLIRILLFFYRENLYFFLFFSQLATTLITNYFQTFPSFSCFNYLTIRLFILFLTVYMRHVAHSFQPWIDIPILVAQEKRKLKFT